MKSTDMIEVLPFVRKLRLEPIVFNLHHFKTMRFVKWYHVIEPDVQDSKMKWRAFGSFNKSVEFHNRKGFEVSGKITFFIMPNTYDEIHPYFLDDCPACASLRAT